MCPIKHDTCNRFLRVVVTQSLSTHSRARWQGVPPEALDGIRMGRITTLSKPDGGVQSRMVGDKRLVARTITKQIKKKRGGESHSTKPIRIEHKGWLRVRGAHLAGRRG